MIQNRVEVKSTSDNKSKTYIAFLWHIIEPHLITEASLQHFDKKLEEELKQNESSDEKRGSKSESQERDEIDFERDSRLVREFLKTALALDCFRQGFHKLDDAKSDYKSI